MLNRVQRARDLLASVPTVIIIAYAVVHCIPSKRLLEMVILKRGEGDSFNPRAV